MLFKSDKEAGRFFIIAFIPLAIFLGIMISRYRIMDNNEYFKKYILPTKYHSIVCEKHIDNKNHGFRTIILNPSMGNSIIASDDWVGLWEYLEVGDSILKNHGDSIITLRKKNDSVFNFHFNFEKSGVAYTRR